MNYEKKYNDLVEKLKKAASDPEWEDERFCCVINEHFPECKESEDESIRKYLTSFVELNSGVNLPPEEAKKILAWIEKHGKKGENGNEREIPNSEWSEEDEKTFSRICGIIHHAAYENYDVDEDGEELGEYARIINWFKSLKERVGCEVNCTTMWKPSSEQMEAIKDAIEFLGCTKKVREELKSLYEQLKKLKES